MKNMLLEDDRIRLRALEPEDLDLLYQWENDSTLWEWGTTLSPFSRYVLKEYIAESYRGFYELRQLRLMIERKSAAREVIGMADLFDFDPHHRRAAIGLLIDSAYQKQGYGREVLGLLEAYAFDFLKLNQLYVHIPQTNTGSRLLFEHSHFKLTGTLAEWISTPIGFVDVLVFQYLQKDWAKQRLASRH